jgi:hypothetical protein
MWSVEVPWPVRETRAPLYLIKHAFKVFVLSFDVDVQAAFKDLRMWKRALASSALVRVKIKEVRKA